MNEMGYVYIVGAGPGDPDLITVRGLRCLRRADVVVYDRLAPLQLLAEAPLQAELINVGKMPDHHPCPQSAINALLVDKARQGNVVVRLKGGDPFVFGRGGEECQALAAAGVSFEVVPGISSAIAAPAYAGIPVTQRGLASAFAVVTGHTSGADTFAVDWAAFAQIDTLVILMGWRHLPEIVQQLIAHGRPSDTPVAVIHWGTTAKQVVVQGTLATIDDDAKALRPPVVIVVGPVVDLRQQLDWFMPTASVHDIQWATTGVVAAELVAQGVR